MIELENLSMNFRISADGTNSIKDFFIKASKNKVKFKILNALNNVSFKVEEGEILGIIGKNGAGKSTLMKIIAGVLKPSSGNVEVKGNIAPMLELGSGFDFELTALENIYLNGAMLGYTKKFVQSKVDEILEFADLKEFKNERVATFSSGMVSRLAFSIACAREKPDILILDEILSVGDIFFRKKSEDKMMELIKSGTTVLLVSHSLDTIKNNCTKVLWLEKGVVKMIGNPKEVCDNYQRNN